MTLFPSLLVYAAWLAVSAEALRQVHGPSRLTGHHGSNLNDLSAGRKNDDGGVISPDHAFYDNYKKNFSWFDPVKQQALFGVKPSEPRVKKRAGTGGPPNTAPVLPNTDCLGCDQQAQGATVDISLFTVEYFIDNALWAKGQGNSKCVFYSPAYGVDVSEWENAKGSTLAIDPEQNGYTRLSGVATTYACANGMKAIWTTWPGQAADNEQSQSTHYQYNYWEIYKDGSWINGIAKDGQAYTYFSHMSQALAEICTGDIYVMSVDPLNLVARYSGPNPKPPYNPSILIKVELDTLTARHNQGDRVNRLFAIDALAFGQIYQLNWGTYDHINTLSRREIEEEHPWLLGWINGTAADHSRLAKRGTCSANLAYETYDWFG